MFKLFRIISICKFISFYSFSCFDENILDLTYLEILIPGNICILQVFKNSSAFFHLWQNGSYKLLVTFTISYQNPIHSEALTVTNWLNNIHKKSDAEQFMTKNARAILILHFTSNLAHFISVYFKFSSLLDGWIWATISLPRRAFHFHALQRVTPYVN